jgi:hypothetical protein
MAISIQALKLVSSGLWPVYARLGSEILVGIVAYGLVLVLLHHNYLRGILQFVRASRLGPNDVTGLNVSSGSESE